MSISTISRGFVGLAMLTGMALATGCGGEPQQVTRTTTTEQTTAAVPVAPPTTTTTTVQRTVQ